MSSNIKYIGLDVHKEAISIAVVNGAGKLVMESIIESNAVSLLQCLQGLPGQLHLTLEEGCLGGLAVRRAQAWRAGSCGVQSAP